MRVLKERHAHEVAILEYCESLRSALREACNIIRDNAISETQYDDVTADPFYQKQHQWRLVLL